MGKLALNYYNTILLHAQSTLNEMEDQIEDLNRAIEKISSLRCSYSKQSEILTSLEEERNKLQEEFDSLTNFKSAFNTFQENLKDTDKELYNKYEALLTNDKLKKQKVHVALDILGIALPFLVPLAGELCDVANAILYLLRGEFGNFLISVVAIIPLAGILATGAKYVWKYTKYIWKHGDDVVKVISKKYR